MSRNLRIIIIGLILRLHPITFAQIDLSSTTAWQQNATTVAGSSSSRLNGLQGIHVDENDTLYIADTGNNRVVVMRMNATNISMVLGTGYGSGLTQFDQPRDVFVTRTAIYILDSRNYRVQTYAKNGTFIATVAGMTDSSGNVNTMNKIGNAYSLFVDSDDYLYVSDSDNHRVLRFPPNSTNGTNGVIVAGTGTVGSGPNQLYNPRGIYVDNTRTLYIADMSNHRIQKWAYGACYGITVAGTGSAGTSLDRLNNPSAVSVDANGYLYIVDQNNHRILRWPNFECVSECIAGHLLTYSGQTPDRLSNPMDLSFGDDGSLYVCDYGNNRVQKFQSIGSTQETELSTATSILLETVANESLVLSPSAQWMTNATTIAGANAVRIDAVFGIAVDQDDTLYVTDSSNHRIVVMRSNSTNASTTFGSGPGSGMNQFNSPTEVVVAGTVIYVLDYYNYRVQKYAKNGTFIAIAAGITSSSGNQNTLNRFGLAYGLAVDSLGYLYVSDGDNHRILRFPPNSTNGTNGVVVAGTGTGGSGPNQLYYPRRFFVDHTRTLYIADTRNHRIQKWPYGACYGITVAGTGSAGTGLGQLYNPVAVKIDQNGYLYIVDQSNNRILRWGSNECMGECIAACSTNNAGSNADRLNAPRDIAFDSKKFLYVADAGNRRVQKFLVQSDPDNTNRSRIQLSCIAKATINNDALSIHGSSDYPSSSCDECICQMVRMNVSTTVVCREETPSCRMIYSHPSLLMSYVRIDLNSRICYRPSN